MAEPIVMNPQHPVESHFREFLQPQHNNSKARYDKFESSKLLTEKDANELLHKRIQNSKAKKVSTQHMGKSKDFPLESYMVPPQFQRNNYYIDQYHHPHHNLQPVHPPPPFYSGHVDKMQPTILPQTQHDNKLQNGYNVGMHQQSNSSPLHHEKLPQDNGLETKSETNTGKRPPSPRELDNTAKKGNFDLDVSDLNTSQDKDDELDKILPLIMGDKWAELGTELNLEMFNDSVWDKSMEKPPSPDDKESTANNSSDIKQSVLTTMVTMSNNPQGPMNNTPGGMNNNPQGGGNMNPQGAPVGMNPQSAPVGMNPGQGAGIINGIKTETEPSPLSKVPPPNVTISPNNGASAPPINRTRASSLTSLNSPQLMNNNNHIPGLPTSQPNNIQPNTMKKEQQSPHQNNNTSTAPNPQLKQAQPQLSQINNMNQQQMVNQQHLSQQQINQLNHHHQQQHLMSQQISQQMQKQLSQQNNLIPKHSPISSLNNSVSIGSMVTTSPALTHRSGNKSGGAPQGVSNAQYLIQNPRSPLTQMGQQPGKMAHGNPTSPHTAVSHPSGPHSTGPSQDTSILNRTSVPNVTVTTGYRPNGSTPEEDRMATVQRQQVKNALHQKIKENALQGQNNKQKLQNEELHRVQSFGAASVSLPQNLVPARMAFNNQAVMQQQGQYPGNMMSVPRSQFTGPGGYTYDRNYHYILQQQQQQHMMQQQQLYYQQMRGSDPNLAEHQGMPGWGEPPGMTQQQYIQRQQMIHQQQQQQMRLQQQMYQQSQQAGSAPHLQSQVPPVPKTDGLTSKSEGDLYNRTIMGMQSRNVVCTMPQRQLHPNSPPIHHPQHPGLPAGMMPSHDMQYNNMIQQQQQQQLGMNNHPSQHPLHMSQGQTMSRIPPQQQQSRPDQHQQQMLHQQQMQQQAINNSGSPRDHTGDMSQQMTHPTLNDVSKFAQQNAMSQQSMMKGPNIAPSSGVSSPTNKQELSESPFNPSLFNSESDFTEDIDSFLQGFDMTSFDR